MSKQWGDGYHKGKKEAYRNSAITVGIAAAVGLLAVFLPKKKIGQNRLY